MRVISQFNNPDVRYINIPSEGAAFFVLEDEKCDGSYGIYYSLYGNMRRHPMATYKNQQDAMEALDYFESKLERGVISFRFPEDEQMEE